MLKYLEKVSVWIIYSVSSHIISTSKYNPLAGSSSIKLSKELDHPRTFSKFNIQNIDDNECFKWIIGRYLNPANHYQARIAKANKNFAKRLDFKGIKFQIKIRNIHKIAKK